MVCNLKIRVQRIKKVLKLLLKKTELMCRIGVEMIHLNQLDDLNTYPSCSVEVSLIFSYFH